MNEIFAAYTSVVGSNYFLLLLSWFVLHALFSSLFDRFLP
jgi:hypothetical protein